MNIKAEQADPKDAPMSGNLATTWLAKCEVAESDLKGTLWCSVNPTPKGMVIIVASHPRQLHEEGLDTASGQRVIFMSRWIFKDGSPRMLGDLPTACVIERGEQYAGNFTEASRLRPINDSLTPENLCILGYEAAKAVTGLDGYKALVASLGVKPGIS